MRVSTVLQEAEGYSLEGQKKAIEEYCAKTGYELLDTYSEQASGRKKDREVVNEVLKRCRSTKSTLIIARLDRFTRDLHFLTKVQKIKGFNFIALDNPNADAMVIQIMMSVAENESRMISVRTKTALKIAKANGVELGNHKSILATYSRLEKDKKLALTRENDNLWDTFLMYRTIWNDYVVNHKNYELFRKYIDPVYEVVDTGLGWEEYIKRTVFEIEGEEWAEDEMSFWDEYQKIYKPEKLIGQRYKGGTFDMNAFGDMCEDAFLFQPLSYNYNSNTENDHRISNSNAFQLPQLDMIASKKDIKETKQEILKGRGHSELHQRIYFRRYTHKAEITAKHSDFLGMGGGEVKVRAYDIGRLWTQLMRTNTKPATIKRVEQAREEAEEIFIPVIEEGRAKGITGIRPLARYLTERRILTPKGNENWSPSSVQSILKLEKAIEEGAYLEDEKEDDYTDDLAMAIVFNGYAWGGKKYHRSKEDGHITDDITPHFDNPNPRI
ncbi:recombinase family protein [Gammaproteobacteria bacterium]|nr:recombinase family protein [Gammaproteobacteria bacterium]